MADYTATAHVFPSANDVRGSLAAGWGKTMYEANVGPYLANILSQGNYAFSGLVLPATSASLSITVGAGTAMIYGHYVAVDATAVTVGASVTSYCYLKLTLDANNNVSAVKYETNTTGTQPSYSILIGKIVSGVGTITSTVQDGMPFGVSHPSKGPVRIGTGSTRSLETFVSATGNLSGTHFYDGDVTLSSAHTLTIPAGGGSLIIVSNGTVTIGGTITGSGGSLLAAGGGGVTTGANGGGGTDQAAGGGGSGSSGDGGSGGSALCHGLAMQSGGAGGTGGGGGGAGTQLTGSSALVADPLSHYGGASGGGGGGDGGVAGGSGGRGGASIVIIAPAVILASTATLNTSGVAGTAGSGANRGGGGGGAAGNVLIYTRSFVDNGATFTQTGGGAGASGGGGAGAGGAGANGIKQILIY